MRKAEDFCKDLDWTYDSDPGRYDLFKGLIEPLIKQAQLEAIEESVKLCAENADIEVVDTEYNHKFGQRFPIWGVSSDSILNCVEILKKEIE